MRSSRSTPRSLVQRGRAADRELSGTPVARERKDGGSDDHVRVPIGIAAGVAGCGRPASVDDDRREARICATAATKVPGPHCRLWRQDTHATRLARLQRRSRQVVAVGAALTAFVVAVAAGAAAAGICAATPGWVRATILHPGRRRGRRPRVRPGFASRRRADRIAQAIDYRRGPGGENTLAAAGRPATLTPSGSVGWPAPSIATLGVPRPPPGGPRSDDHPPDDSRLDG